jgi:hypothetical protein
MSPLRKQGAGLAADSSKLKPSLITWYQILRVVQGPFTSVFWAIEKRVSKIEDELANQGRSAEWTRSN